jgi:hypothetical protein
MITKKIVGLIMVVFLVFGFSIAGVVLQALNFGSRQKLPEGDIVDYELTTQQANLILSQGKMILRYEYSPTCENCSEYKSYLEQLTYLTGFKGQMFLQEIISNETFADLPILDVLGFTISENRYTLFKDTLQGNNVTEGNILNSVCELILRPPVDCALQNVTG